MAKEITVLNKDNIKDKIYTIRGQKVMLDKDLAKLYGVETKNLNRAVKRNIERFPERFMFQLTEKEYDNLRFQFGTSRFTTQKSQKWGGRRYLPLVFTEQGVAMLSAVLKSDTAIKISIQIIEAFIEMRKIITSNSSIYNRLDVIEKKQLIFDNKFNQIFDAIENKIYIPEEGIFYDGQVFSAYKFLSNLIKKAKKNIKIIDNYIDDSILTLLEKRGKNVKATIYTQKITKNLFQSIKKHNSEHPTIEIKEIKNFHDRFVIIDDKEIYHIGASLKDLGKKVFAFSKINKDEIKILDKIKEQSNSDKKSSYKTNSHGQNQPP